MPSTIAVDRYMMLAVSTRKAIGPSIRRDISWMMDLLEMPTYYRIRVLKVETDWWEPESGTAKEVEYQDSRLRPRPLGHRRKSAVVTHEV